LINHNSLEKRKNGMKVPQYGAMFSIVTLLCGSVSAQAQTILTTDTTISDARYANGVVVRDGATPPTHVILESGAAFPNAQGAAVEAFGSSYILAEGGDIHAPAGGLWLRDKTIAVLKGGSIQGFSALSVQGESRLLLQKGVVSGWTGVSLDESGKAIMEGGEIHGLLAVSVAHSAVFDLYGGLLKGSNTALGITLGGTANLYGGILRSDTNLTILVGSGGVLNIYGADLTWDPVSGLLSGNLARGGAVEGRIVVRNGGILNLVAVPEPGVVTLLTALIACGVCRRRRNNGSSEQQVIGQK
jgi:hypothetical protein